MLNDIFNILLPQLALVGTIIILLILGMILSPRFYRYSRLISLIGISFAIVLLTTVQIEPQYFGFFNSVMSDSYTLLFDFIILFCGFLITILSKNNVKSDKRNAYTYQAILLTAILGAINVVSANDFLTLFVSMELLGFSTYFLIASTKGYPSKEASFKYLITSAVSSGIFLLGASYLYGITGFLNFSYIYERMSENSPSQIYSIASILVCVGIISKLAIFPFANWVIDVYKGCETSVLAFLSTIPKLAVFGILCRLIVFPLNNFNLELMFTLMVLSIITALWANTYALREKNVKVILACSASANASYILLTACPVFVDKISIYNVSAVIFYLICYSIINIGVFAFLNIFENKNKMFINDFKGLFKNNSLIVAAYSILILALAGIPITSGFIAKIYIFSAIAKSGLIFIPFLLVILVLTVVALFYYIKLLSPLFEEHDKNSDIQKPMPTFSQKFVLIFTAIITVALGLFPEKLIELCWFIAYNI